VLPQRWAPLLVLSAGALLTLAFAPTGLWPLALAAPALLFLALEGVAPRRAAWLGFCFGVGMFAAGTWWLYLSIQGFGKAPVWLAVSLVAALVALMAGYHALLGYLAARWLPVTGPWRWLAGLPALWWLLEWLRGWFLSGFGWLSLGYTQTDTWLAGYAPIGGAHFISLVLVMMAGALVMLQREWAMGDLPRSFLPRSFLPWAVLIVPWPLGAALDRIDWTRPAGAPVQVAVIQGAIPQDQKWVAENLEVTITRYRDLTLRSLGVPLIVWPEAAIPDLANNHIPLLRSLAQQTEVHGSSLLMGLIRSEVLEKGAEPLYFNSILALGEDPQFYDKHHLVPFAEFFPVPAPVRRWLRLMSLPYSDFTAGAAQQPPLRIAGLVLEASICYEDGYASSRLPALEQATALVNVTNDAWFGRSPARYQHLQISRMRAQEARRFMIRAANDGVSAVIGPRGELVATAPEYRAAVLRAAVEPRSGLPPYARTGNLPLIVFALALLAAALWRARRRALVGDAVRPPA
jgi:apolipoprotein N-acyltransferase